jgi:hypothetical protein
MLSSWTSIVTLALILIAHSVEVGSTKPVDNAPKQVKLKETNPLSASASATTTPSTPSPKKDVLDVPDETITPPEIKGQVPPKPKRVLLFTSID